MREISINEIEGISIGQTENIKASQDLVGTLSAQVMSEAIKRAVISAKSAYVFLASSDVINK